MSAGATGSAGAPRQATTVRSAIAAGKPSALRRRRSATRVAAVAIGSTSVHFTAASLTQRGIRILADESVLLELGSAVDAYGHVPPDRLDQLAATLRQYAAASEALGARAITVVGTEPLRGATNIDSVAEVVRTVTSGPLHLLGHDEEALLSLYAVLGGRHPSVETLVVDIGGGSSEYVLARPGRTPLIDVVPTGAARLTAALVRHDPPTADEFDALHAAARRAVGRAVVASPGKAIMVGGTATNLLRLVSGTSSWRSLTLPRLEAAIRVLEESPLEALAAGYPIRPQRARILPGGAVLADAFLEHYALSSATVSRASIREGILMAVARTGEAWRQRLPELAAGE